MEKKLGCSYKISKISIKSWTNTKKSMWSKSVLSRSMVKTMHRHEY